MVCSARGPASPLDPALVVPDPWVAPPSAKPRRQAGQSPWGPSPTNFPPHLGQTSSESIGTLHDLDTPTLAASTPSAQGALAHRGQRSRHAAEGERSNGAAR